MSRTGLEKDGKRDEISKENLKNIENISRL